MKKVVRFVARDLESPYLFLVMVYPNASALQIAAEKFDKKRNKMDERGYEGIGGISQHFSREKLNFYGNVAERKSLIGIIRLHRKALTIETISHECIHAACWQYRLEQEDRGRVKAGKGTVSLGLQCSEKEEEFAYLYGRLLSSVMEKLKKVL